MRKKNWYLLTILLLVGSLLLAACGGDTVEPTSPPVVEPTDAPVVEPTDEPMVEPTDEPMEVPTDEPMDEPTEEPEEEATEEPVEEPTEEAEEEVILSECAPEDERLTIWADDTRSQLILDINDAFYEEYGVCLEVAQLDFGNIRDRLNIAGPAGEGPDVLIGAHDWLGELVVNGLVAPLDRAAYEDNFLEAALEGCSYDGELYCMPYAVENVAFFYNTDLVPEAPTTWDEVREISEELVSSGASDYGYVIQQNDPYHFFPLMTSFGGYVFGLTDEGYDSSDVGIDSEGTVAAAEWLDGMVEDGLTPAGLDYDSMHSAFVAGDAAMMVTGPWAIDQFLAPSDVPYAIANIPTGTEPGRPFLGVQGFMINAFSDQQLLAEIFLSEFVATEEVMGRLYEIGRRPVAYRAVFDAIDDEDFAAFAAAGENGLPMPAIPAMGAVWTAWGNAKQLVITQELEPAEAFDDAAEQIRTTIEESGG